MLLNYKKKELTPIIYGESSIKHHRFSFGPNSQCTAPHWHERIELLYVRKGTMNITVGQRLCTVNSGGVAVAAPCELHGATSGIDGVLYDVFMFDVSDLKNSTFASDEYINPVISGNIGFINPLYDPQLCDILDTMLNLLEKKKSGERALLILGKMYEILGIIYKYSILQSAVVTDKRLDNVLEYINRNFKSSLSTGDLCKKFGYDEAYFCRRFKAVTGLSVIKYIHALKLEKACEYIKIGSPIGEAAKECGFGDAGYFSRCFKLYFGMSPTEYREKNK